MKGSNRRRYFTEAELGKLISAARKGRWGQRDARDKPIAPASPWQNGFAERLIGSIRRECVDHFVVWGETHLRRILRTYARYYNDIRTHWSLDKDAQQLLHRRSPQ